MKPTQRNCNEFVRHRDDLADGDFYRRRASELRRQALRNGVPLKPALIGLVMIVAFPIVAMVATAALRAVNIEVAAHPTAVPAR